MCRVKKRIIGFGTLLVALTAGIWAGGCGRNQEEETKADYPQEAVEMVAPAGPGSGYDLTARSIVRCLQQTKLVPVPLPVTNKPGGGGKISLEYLNENAGRNDILSVFSPPLCLINLNGSTDLNYKESTTPVGMLAVDYGCFAVRADSPYQNLNQVMEQLRNDPKSVRIGGTSTYGSMDHIQFLKIAMAAGVENLNEVPYEGFENGGAAAQLMGNRVDVLSSGISDVVGLVESGDIRVLAVTSGERLEGNVISQIPTCIEQGIDAEFQNWRGIFGPRDMPEYAVEYWEKTLETMSEKDEWKNICRRYGWTREYKGHKEFEAYLDEMNEEYRGLLQEIGMAQ